ncbi:EF-hand domain-containing protein [Novosphingobium sp. TH158]|uniref:EF-hand domain-containing protein n=1 Tax=Novosphingobium sp. TH158 TaxID=2067455 RepID=UPI001181972A|nr:EF-hand domain-containing protein [Novosphingobium sp. TH158]
MNRTVLGAFAALLLVAAGLFWWQGRAALDVGAPPPKLADRPLDEGLPDATGQGMRGALPPEASEATREQRRFDRLDRNRDSKITRVEMLTPRVAAFRKLDTDGNNLLSFEEWAVKTSNRFKGADRNGDSSLDRAEFATTKPKPKAKPACNCGPAPKTKAAAPKKAAAEVFDDEAEE